MKIQRAQIKWWLVNLAISVILWNSLFVVEYSLGYLIYPEFGIGGAKVFQVIHRNISFLPLIASLFAINLWLLEDIICHKLFIGQGLLKALILRISSSVFVFLLGILLSSVVYYQGRVEGFSEYWQVLKPFVMNRATLYLFILVMWISMFVNFLKIIIQNTGLKLFLPIIMGYYRKPKEENRIFIFIDLISSTKYAEILGHKKYSAFIQKCFQCLGVLEIKYHAVQYQIVGDEVVLTWTANEAKNFLFAIYFYYEFVAILKDKATDFIEEFGIVPEFTASINTGKIMVTEVGSFKSEIAFHGDVLNTAARIQKQCKSYNKDLLVTEAFINGLPAGETSKVTSTWIDKVKLTGKQIPVNLYALDSDLEF